MNWESVRIELNSVKLSDQNPIASGAEIIEVDGQVSKSSSGSVSASMFVETGSFEIVSNQQFFADLTDRKIDAKVLTSDVKKPFELDLQTKITSETNPEVKLSAEGEINLAADSFLQCLGFSDVSNSELSFKALQEMKFCLGF